ncbi:hypothetical protein [Bacillus ndiopicus]|uniref:hypothetical protein n=1 Tax=Bacillus ndiopicus TaxID=1347368 RepID=UPI0005A96E62|nr:hypothetical protein [Bacillus ndiopicus]
MSAFAKYERTVEMSRKRKYVGEFECKFRPLTEYAQSVFAKHIAVNDKKEDSGIFRRLLSGLELNKIQSKLTEENFVDAGFNEWNKISEWEYEESGYVTFKARVLNNFCKKYGLTPQQVSLKITEFIPFPEIKQLDFEDIKDLREFQ